MMRASGVLVVVAVGLVPAAAHAGKPRAHHAVPAPATVAPPAPAPSVTLTIAPVSAKRWTMRLENSGQVPLRVVADPRLLSFDVKVPALEPKKAKTVTCTLPADMRPSDDRERAVSLPPGKAYKESFDPRLYCFGAKESAALVSGAEVVARYGFAVPKARAHARAAAAPAPSPPFAIEGPDLAPTKEVASAPWSLTGDAVAVTLPATPPVTRATTDADVSLVVSMSPRVDAGTAPDASASITVANEGSRPTYVYFRPQTVGFEVVGPSAATAPVTCSAPGGGAIRELYTRLAPRGRTSMAILLEASCPDHAFDLPGLYEVRPVFDTRRVAGAPPNLASFTGEIVGNPSLVRIHRGKPFVVTPPPMVE